MIPKEKGLVETLKTLELGVGANNALGSVQVSKQKGHEWEEDGDSGFTSQKC